MAKQNGIIKLKGSLGGITFFQRNGADFSKTQNGPSKERIQNDPNFVRTRENNAEFGGATTAAKGFRLGLVLVLKSMSDNKVNPRLVRIFKAILNRGDGLRGERPVQLLANKDLILGFEFHEQISLDSMLLAPFTLHTNANRNKVTLNMPDFNSRQGVQAPRPATHFRIVSVMNVLSEYVFNTESKSYEPNDKVFNSAYDLSASDYIPLNGMVGAETVIVTNLPGNPVLPATSALIVTVGIEFYQSVSGKMYLLGNNSCMKVKEVF